MAKAEDKRTHFAHLRLFLVRSEESSRGVLHVYVERVSDATSRKEAKWEKCLYSYGKDANIVRDA